jgi:hypothetical protein
MKKFLSYSLFGSDLKYYVGAEKNITVNQKLLPNWETLIYFHPGYVREDYIEKLKKLGGFLVDVSNIVVGEKNSLDFPYFWRFLTFLNDGLHLSRDLDSRLSNREVEYIKRWEDSNCKYFIIRDHPWHAVVPSGLFGVRDKDHNFESHFHNYIKNNNLVWGTDQDILYQFIQNVNGSDIFYCGFDKLETYIPRDDKQFYIGIQLDEHDKPTIPSGEQCLKFLIDLNL